MFRFAVSGVLLLAFASAAAAGEHYVEIWNPPEARLAQPPVSGKPGAGKAPPGARHASKATPRRVADPVARSAPGKHVADSLKSATPPRPANIPRIITPEGNVLRVNDGGAPVQVLR